MCDYLIQRNENIDYDAPQPSIKDILLWTQLADPNSFTTVDIERVRKEHLEKLDRYRARKDWEAWVEEDELDLEGERIISEIKNFKDEFFYKVASDYK